MRKWLVNNTSVYFFSSPGLWEHDFLKKTAKEKRWSARVSRLECTRSPRPVDRGRPQCPVSYPDNNSASHLFRSPYSWITMRRALRKGRVFDFVPSYLKGLRLLLFSSQLSPLCFQISFSPQSFFDRVLCRHIDVRLKLMCGITVFAHLCLLGNSEHGPGDVSKSSTT